MKISYTLYPGFLHTHQAATRRALEGIVVAPEVQTPISIPTRPQEVEIFKASDRQELLTLPPIVLANTRPEIRPTPQVRKPIPEVVPTPSPVTSPVLQTTLSTESEPKITPETQKNLQKPASKPAPKPGHRLAQWGLTGVILTAVIAALVILTPNLYYQLFPADTVPIEAASDGTPIGGAFQSSKDPEPTPRPLPPQDASLPTGTWLVIPRIGVRTEITPGEDQETALQDGVWLVPEYGRPGDITQPVIMAAHRYGWQWWWQTDYWKYHSFYNLPQLEPGDIVEVIDDQRKYYYEIYAGEEGEEITDYSADMILYTCKFLSSPLRHFRYARLIDMNKDTQVGQPTQVSGQAG